MSMHCILSALVLCIQFSSSRASSPNLQSHGLFISLYPWIIFLFYLLCAPSQGLCLCTDNSHIYFFKPDLFLEFQNCTPNHLLVSPLELRDKLNTSKTKLWFPLQICSIPVLQSHRWELCPSRCSDRKPWSSPWFLSCFHAPYLILLKILLSLPLI